jgi:hypothetical protein
LLIRQNASRSTSEARQCLGQQLDERLKVSRLAKQIPPAIAAVQDVINETGFDLSRWTGHGRGRYRRAQINQSDPFICPNTFLAAIDLAFLFATFWTPQQRHENDRELKCLRRYHEKLIESGVRGFDLDRLFTDYRTAVAMMVFYPIWDCVIGGSRRAYWWPKLQCLTAAYRDWKCEEN